MMDCSTGRYILFSSSDKVMELAAVSNIGESGFRVKVEASSGDTAGVSP
jgi:hypothetical protein